MEIQLSSDVLDGLVLAALHRENQYGYSLTQYVQSYVQVSESTLYPVLRRLKKNQLVETYDEQYQGRNRRYYQITAQGQAYLLDFREAWTRYQTQINHMLGEEN